ncbi:MAG: iron complex outermembrane receptor protein [Lentimonas sp.]
MPRNRQNYGPFEPDPVNPGVGKGTERNRRCTTLTRPWPDLNRTTIEIQMNYTRHLLAVAALAGPLYAQGSAPASAAATEPLPQLASTTVVTGTLWESELQNTTASVTVIDAESIRSSGTQHFGDLINSIPNLTWTGGSSRPRYIQIRGIGENSQFEGETPDSSVRFLIDDLDLTGLGTVGNLFDVQQVEVLRGPQAGAFGANAAGGVVKIVTNDPTPYWTGQTEATIGNDSLKAGGFAIGGPLLKSDPAALSFRLSLHQLTQDGFRDNRFLNRDDSNERDELTTRLKLRWLANEDWQWDGTLFYADANNGYDEWSLDNTEFDTYSDELGRDEQESFGTSIRGTWTGLDNVEVTSVTSFVTTDSLNSYDGDWTNTVAVPLFTNYSGFLAAYRQREVFSEEIRFDSTDQQYALGWIDRWTIGSYIQIFREDTDVNYTDEYASGIVKSEYATESLALFGQVGHDFSERLHLTLGLRGEYHSVDFDSTTIDDYSGSLLPSSKTKQSNTLFGGKISLEYELNDAHSGFGSITRGYKAGGANSGSFRQLGDPIKYDKETLWNYEIGLRSKWLEGTLTSQVTAFFLDRQNIQLRDSSGSGGFFQYFTSNQGDAQHFGLEAETTWWISPNWQLSANLGLMEAEADNTTRDLSNTPHYTYNVRVDYASDCGFFANLEVTGSDSYYESNSATNSEKRSDFTVVNTAIGYNYENWTLTLWAKNLFDQGYEKRVFFFDNGYGDTRYENPAAPQHFGATLNYSW